MTKRIKLEFFRKGDLENHLIIHESNVYHEYYDNAELAGDRINELLITHPNLLIPNSGIRLNGIRFEGEQPEDADKLSYTMLEGMVVKGNRKARYAEMQELIKERKDISLREYKFEKGELSEEDLSAAEKVRVKILQSTGKLKGKVI